jgi:polysaccharide chain length determinant protein (PEP-CTERM system associated)
MIIHKDMTVQDYVSILRRRAWLLVIPTVICAICGFAASYFVQSRYVSQTVVLVESQAVPDNIVKPVVGDVNERLSTMQEEILSRTRLLQIIDKFGLYKDEKRRLTEEEQIARLRKAIVVSAVRPMAETRANGLPGFTVEVTASQPALAQRICGEISTFFRQQNEHISEVRAENTTDFLNTQLQEAKAKLDAQDAKLADFQRRYMGELPDETQTNFNLLSGLTSQMQASSEALGRAQQDKIFLESMISQQAALPKASQAGPSPDALDKQLADLQSQLAVLLSRYTDEHPDVVKARNEIAQVQKRIQDEASARPPAPATEQAPDPAAALDSPQVKQLRAQLRQVELTIKERTEEQTRLQHDIQNLQAKLQLSPQIAQEYKALTRDSQTALTIYNDLLKKHSDSEMATDLERRQQGERFRVLDEPSLPQKPSFPNRAIFAIGGLMGGLAVGVGIAALLEMQDTSLRTERDVEAILKLPTLALIPEIDVPGADTGFSDRLAGQPQTATVNLGVGS